MTTEAQEMLKKLQELAVMDYHPEESQSKINEILNMHLSQVIDLQDKIVYLNLKIRELLEKYTEIYNRANES